MKFITQLQRRCLLLGSLLLLTCAGVSAQSLDFSRTPVPAYNLLDGTWVYLTTDHLYTNGPDGEETLVAFFEPTLAKLVKVVGVCGQVCYQFLLENGQMAHVQVPNGYDTANLFQIAEQGKSNLVAVTF